MDGSIEMKGRLMICLIVTLLIVGYIGLWKGWSENNQLSALHEVKLNCYSYQSDSDLKAIAKRAIYTNLGGVEAVKSQKRLAVSNETQTEYYISGRPSGMLKMMVSYLLGWDYVPRATVILTKDSQEKCVYISEALFQKD